MDSHLKLLRGNHEWAREKLSLKQNFFEETSREQRPEFLWIGCSDSRVPADEITGSQPGEIFVHRNIANLVVHTDLNLMSVVQYSVDVLKVKHIIVCGHYGCGGIKSAMGNEDFGLLNKWLRHIKDVYRFHRDELDKIENPDERYNRLVEMNVLEQTYNIAETSIVQRAWREEMRPSVHGWVYDLKSGRLKELVMLRPGELPDPIYRVDPR